MPPKLSVECSTNKQISTWIAIDDFAVEITLSALLSGPVQLFFPQDTIIQSALVQVPVEIDSQAICQV